MKILGIRIDNLEKKEILKKISLFLNESRFHQIATVNAEFILESQKNPEFKKIPNGCDLNVADGISIRYAFWRFGKHLKTRLTGADLMQEILHLAAKKEIPIFLAARSEGLSTWQETREAILKIYPNLEIYGDDYDLPNFEGPTSEELKRPQSQTSSQSNKRNENPVARQKVSTLDSRLRGNDRLIVFCNFGAPHQELFINSQKCDTIRLAIGVGGSFDFLTGKIRRAPKFMRKIGLEWFWRLLQPQEWKFKKKRWRRIFKAVIIFPIRVIFNK